MGKQQDILFTFLFFYIYLQKSQYSSPVISSPSPTTNIRTVPEMNNKNNRTNNDNAHRIGRAPQTVSILTALNDLVISEELQPNPAPPATSAGGRKSSGGSAGNNVPYAHPSNQDPSPSKPSANLIHPGSCHPTYHHTSKNGDRGYKVPGRKSVERERRVVPGSQSQASVSTGTPSALHPSGPSSYNFPSPASPPNRGFNSVPVPGAAAHRKGLIDSHETPQNGNGSTIKARLCSSSQTQVSGASSPSSRLSGKVPLPGGHGNGSFVRKGSGGGGGGATAKQLRNRSKSRTPDWIWKIFQLIKHGKLEDLVNNNIY